MPMAMQENPDGRKRAAIAAAIGAYLEMEAMERAGAQACGQAPGMSPWRLFGRLELMRARNLAMSGGGRRSRGSGVSEAVAVRHSQIPQT